MDVIALYLIEILHQTTTVSGSAFPSASLYLIEILHQTTTLGGVVFFAFLLYLIEILHQTTTFNPIWLEEHGCILSKFYIKPQQAQQSPSNSLRCILSKFYIKPQRRDYFFAGALVVSYRNSTSNHNLYPVDECPAIRCILSKFYIKPQLLITDIVVNRGCILSKFYIKPQQIVRALVIQIVVSYRNSTSNHNTTQRKGRRCSVVSYRNSTSNHNAG